MRARLAAGGLQVLSLDVFDTLIWRRMPEPADVFLLLARDLAARGHLAPHVSPVQFVELRRAAERAAREKVEAATGYREIRLRDIYASLSDALFAPDFDVAARAAAELSFEAALMLLDTELVALIREAKQAGVKVLLVSDTYFSSDEVLEFLTAAGFTAQDCIDRLYVSCEAGKPKYRDLFDTILTDVGTPAATFMHVGDNLEADVLPCRQRGIACVHYDKWAFAPRVRTEEFPADINSRVPLLDAGGDFGLTGLRARLWNRAPADLTPELSFFWRYGAAILAPVFAGFARWVLKESKGAAITGVMREGRFLDRVVAACAVDMGQDIGTNELWLSRRAVIRAALWEDDVRLLPEAVALTPARTTDELLRELALTPADIASVIPNFDLRRPGARGHLASAIPAMPALRTKVLALSQRLRANLLKGLAAQTDLTRPLVLMDLGYAATIQTVLARILRRENVQTPVTGLYLAVNEKAMVNVGAGVDIRAWLNEEGFAGMIGALLSRTPDVLEHACMCREGSLAGYDDAGQPVLLENQRDTRQLEQMETMQAGILAGLPAVNAMLGDMAPDTSSFKRQVTRIIETALLHPTMAESEALGAWQHEANFDLADVRRLRDLAFDPRALEYRGWPALQEVGRHQTYWPGAAFAHVAPFFGQVFAGGLRQAYAAEHLASGPALGVLSICPDLGVGFDAKREGGVAFTVNAFGRGEMSLTVKPANAEAYRALRLRFPPAQAVLSLDQCDVAFVGERDHHTVDLLSDQGRRLTWAGAEAGPAGAILTAPAGTAVILDLSGDTPAWLHMLTLRLRFKYLRLDALFR